MVKNKQQGQQRITFRMSQALNDRLWAIAVETGKSVNTLIEEACAKLYLKEKR